MRKFIALLILLLATYWTFRSEMPQSYSGSDTPDNQFSTERALIHVKAISKDQHYVGSEGHAQVRAYIVSELEKLGLQPEIQKGYTLDRWGGLAKPINILARIQGSNPGKALMLLTHYDSAPHSKSYGASDAGSGVATILEGVRAFLSEGKEPKNDIIVMLSDSEEIGLNGAELFCKQHDRADDVGLVLNFEARGSGGPSYMLMETNGGNKALIKGFKDAKPPYPVSNSLAYSIYKMLPNDTDLTVFREERDIDGFNFAFIDDHYDYHTSNDTYKNLDRNTLEHQGSYLMSMLPHFANSDLSELNVAEGEDDVYFNTPLGFFNYPFSWVLPMVIIAFVMLIGLIAYGVREKRMVRREIAKGFIPFLASLLISGLLAHFGWQLLLKLYPGYGEIQHGFTYNGHVYIGFVAMLSMAICFWWYRRFKSEQHLSSYLVAPLFIWILLNLAFALYLQGGGFFIIPVFFGLISLFVLIRQKEPSIVALALLAIPAILIVAPFIKVLPVGLGLKMLALTATFSVLLFGSLLPILGSIRRKGLFVVLLSFVSLFLFGRAHFTSSFNKERQKPNSLVYQYDMNTDKAYWLSYDKELDSWTKNFLGDDPRSAGDMNLNAAYSKYGSGYRYATEAPAKAIPKPKIEVTKDTLVADKRHIELCIAPQRHVNRVEVFASKSSLFYTLTVNGVAIEKDEEEEFVLNRRWRNKVLSYYFTDQEPLELKMEVPTDQKTELQVLEASFDLLENELFTVPKRPANMIPKPFIMNDAIIMVKDLVIE